MCALYEGCALPAQSIRLWWAAGCLTQNLADFNRRFADGSDPSELNWAGCPSIACAIIPLCSMADWQG
jgi:hypothetical protein